MKIYKFRKWQDNKFVYFKIEADNQSVGLFDRFGEEIYEGDIIKSVLIGYNGVPICDEYTSLMGFYHSVIEYGAKSKDLEIIGNIYENPELLENFSEGECLKEERL